MRYLATSVPATMAAQIEIVSSHNEKANHLLAAASAKMAIKPEPMEDELPAEYEYYERSISCSSMSQN